MGTPLHLDAGSRPRLRASFDAPSAEFYDLPAPYLAKVLNSLVRAGVLTATSGPRGGFRLAKPADEITAAEVLEAVEGRGQLFSCTEIRQRGPVPLTGAACRTPCGIARLMDRAERAWRNELVRDNHRRLGRNVRGRRTRATVEMAHNPGAERGIAPRTAGIVRIREEEHVSRNRRIREAEGRSSPASNLNIEESFVDLPSSKLRLRVLSVGSGPDLVMLHGVSLAAAVWVPC